MNRVRGLRVEGAMRWAPVALAALFLGAQIAATAHRIAVRHRMCEHGQVVHAADEAGAPNVVLAAPPADEHAHGCALYLHRRSTPLVDALAAADAAAPESTPLWAPPAGARSLRLLAVSPSRSPPA